MNNKVEVEMLVEPDEINAVKKIIGKRDIRFVVRNENSTLSYSCSDIDYVVTNVPAIFYRVGPNGFLLEGICPTYKEAYTRYVQLNLKMLKKRNDEISRLTIGSEHFSILLSPCLCKRCIKKLEDAKLNPKKIKKILLSLQDAHFSSTENFDEKSENAIQVYENLVNLYREAEEELADFMEYSKNMLTQLHESIYYTIRKIFSEAKIQLRLLEMDMSISMFRDAKLAIGFDDSLFSLYDLIYTPSTLLDFSNRTDKVGVVLPKNELGVYDFNRAASLLTMYAKPKKLLLNSIGFNHDKKDLSFIDFIISEICGGE